MPPFDNQFLAAAALLRGYSIELATGEGKTLVGAFAATGYAHQGRRVQVLTANDYLAARDAAWMAPLYESLGYSVAALQANSTLTQRQEAYASNVTYLSVSEAGFDLLRDRLAPDPGSETGVVRDIAILDEADAVLLDEARVPLVLAADSAGHGDATAERADQFVKTLEPGRHFEVAADHRTVNFTEAGIAKVESQFPEMELYGADAEFLVTLNLALYANAVLERDVDYVIRDDRVWLVSGTRGRIEELQRWPDGLQFAIETKEGLAAVAGLEVLDQLVIAELIGRYRQVVGMSATMVSAADELHELYDLEVLPIPPNRPCQRTDHPTRLFETGTARDQAVLEEVTKLHAEGRPVLLACQSVRESEHYFELLAAAGLDGVLLNAKNDRDEAAIIARAGEAGRITVSTQMAGRGTDIVLDDQAREAGGLAVIGVGRFTSSRLDNQLRGRSGRQGDPGTSSFLVSLEDRLITDCDPQYPPPQSNAIGEIEPSRANRRVLEVVEHAQRVSDGEQRSLRSMSWRYGKQLRVQREQVLGARSACRDGSAALVLLRGIDHSEALPPVGTTVKAKSSAPGSTWLAEAARLTTLAAIDEAWSSHLAFAAELREGIHLRVLARVDPLIEFEKEMASAFRDLVPNALDDALINLATAVEQGTELSELTSRIPSATWAYTVTDNSLGTELERMGRGLFSR